VQDSRLANNTANSKQPKMLNMTMGSLRKIKLTVVLSQGSGDRLGGRGCLVTGQRYAPDFDNMMRGERNTKEIKLISKDLGVHG